jgi:CheY-like chemotaxis protein
MPSRALVVDNDPSECELIQSVLISAGIEVLSLTNSSDAVVCLKQEKFAVVLLNLTMPAPDGLELSRRMRASGINLMTPIILISDDLSTSAASKGFAAGASLFVYKPIDKSRLLKLVRATQGAIEHERRRFRRVPIQSKVKLGFEKEEWEVETVDISLNGMLVEGHTAVPAGASVRVSIFLAPQARPIVGLGSVVRILDNNRMGIRLSQLTTQESGRLQEFLLPLILKDMRQPSTLPA